MSLGRGGTETVIYSNSAPGEVYYIGVKSEDQQAGDFGFYAVAQQAPFDSENPNGSITFTGSRHAGEHTRQPVRAAAGAGRWPLPAARAWAGAFAR